MREIAPDRAQKITKASIAGQMSGLKRFSEKIRAAKTNRFFTHWRGRSEMATMANWFTPSSAAAARRRSRRDEGSTIAPSGDPCQRLADAVHHGVGFRVRELGEAGQAEHL